MTEREVGIRLSVKDSEVARRALMAFGEDGQRVLQRVTRAADEAGPGLSALNEITGAGRGVMEGFAGRLGAVGSALGALGSIGGAVAAGIGALAAVIGTGLGELSQAEQSTLRLDAVLRATGNTAGMTSDQIGELADSLEADTMASAEAVRDASAVMATFRSVSGDAFTQAIVLAQDLAATFGGDVKSSATMLGKALEDPANGLTALRRVGVSFSDAQKDMIAGMAEAGDVAGAQAAILATLETQVGGAGAGEASGLTGATKHLGDAWGNLLEEFARTSGAGENATNYLKYLTELTNKASAAIADTKVEIKIEVAEGQLEKARSDLDAVKAVQDEINQMRQQGLTDADPEIASRQQAIQGRLEAVRKAEEEVFRLKAEAAAKGVAQASAADMAALHQAEMAGSAQKAHLAKLQADLIKSSTDAAMKRRAVEEKLTADIAAEEDKRGRDGIGDDQIDRAITLMRQRADQQIAAIEAPGKVLADRTAKALADDHQKYLGIVADLKQQILKVTDERAAFVNQAVSRLPESLRGREEIVAQLRAEATETYNAVAAMKLLDEAEERSADSRRKLEDEGRRLHESVRSAAEKHADQLLRVNDLYEQGVISAQDRARAIKVADEEMAKSGSDSFGELKQAVEGWGRSSARYIAQAFTSGEKSAVSFGSVVMNVLSEILERLIYVNITSKAVDGISSGIGGLGGMFSGLFGSSGGQGAASTADTLAFYGTELHAGGVPADGAGRPRLADPRWYDDAPRYHNGKPAPSLYPGERAAIILDTEEVLTMDDPRHSANLGRGGGTAVAVNVPVYVNVTAPAGSAAKSDGAKRNSDGSFSIDVMVEMVEESMSNNIQRGQGLAPTLESKYGLNPANGSFG